MERNLYVAQECLSQRERKVEKLQVRYYTKFKGSHQVRLAVRRSHGATTQTKTVTNLGEAVYVSLIDCIRTAV
jgi:hypothetical protein